jgi:hypothetical protein
MSEGKIGKQPPATGELGVQITRRPHLEGCPALSGDNPCGCYENAIPNLIPDDVSPDERRAVIERAKAAGEKHKCPRRAEGHLLMPGEDPDDETPDSWVALDVGVIGATGRHCSFCGSLHPDEFMAHAENRTAELGPTDKSYKVYLTGDNLGPNGDKFYFQHLSHEQRTRFIELLNARTMRIGYPGHFYRRPFFAVSVE